jgi:hypothetical protein
MIFKSSVILWLVTCLILITSVHDVHADDDHSVEQRMLITLSNYRHRFERSMNFKKLRWTLNSIDSTAMCTACSLLLPEVRHQTDNTRCMSNTNIHAENDV